jgi:hypothetical protein
MNMLTTQIRAQEWHPMRWTALIAGLLLIVHWLLNNDPVSGVFSMILLLQAFSGTGCLRGQCKIPDANHKTNTLKDS